MKKIFLLVFCVMSSACVFAQNSYIDNSSGKKIVPYFESKPSSQLRGWDFMLRADTLGYWDLDDAIVEEVLKGNMPDSLKYFRKIVIETAVADSVEVLRKPHVIELWVLPDYISVGNNKDFVRMPMSTLAAQRIADSLYCSLPTSYIADRIAQVSEGALDIFPFRPLGSRNQQPIVYQDSNNAINALFKAKGYHFGQFISGLKKDLILAHKLQNTPDCENHIAIYGWHHPDGRPQQKIHVKHANFYADYSHGARMVYRTIKIDGKEYDLKEVLEDEKMYRLLSDDPGPLAPASYSQDVRHE